MRSKVRLTRQLALSFSLPSVTLFISQGRDISDAWQPGGLFVTFREKLSRAILTPLQPYSPLYSPSLALYLTQRPYSETRRWKIKLDFPLHMKLELKCSIIELLSGPLQTIPTKHKMPLFCFGLALICSCWNKLRLGGKKKNTDHKTPKRD